MSAEPTGIRAGVDPLTVGPPDDTGTDTFVRYRYQAHIAVPFALSCAIGGDVRSVVLEHFEDIAVEYATSWRFMQVKTRDAGLRRWRMVDLCADGGGLRALLRSFRAVGPIDATHELWLEGALERRDQAERLLDAAGRSDPAVQSDVATRLGIDPVECAEFLTRLRVRPNLPSRSDIGARVYRLLCTQAPRLATAAVEAIQHELVELLCRAMAAELTMGDDWPSGIVHAITPEMNARVEAKRVTAAILEPVIGPLVRDPQPLLRRVLETDLPPATSLEEKLLTGGATDAIVRDAKQLRYQATLMEANRAAASLYGDESLLEDVRARLQVRANATRDAVGDETRPAARMWLSLLELLSSQARHVDANGLFGQDPDILLGEICEMSDLCQVDWGLANA